MRKGHCRKKECCNKRHDVIRKLRLLLGSIVCEDLFKEWESELALKS